MSKTRAAEAAHAETLAELVVDFRDRLGPEGPLEHGYMDAMRDAESWREAVLLAVRSTMPNGKRHNHQSRVPMDVLLAYGKRIRKSRARYADSFHQLLWLCERSAIKGIGPVTVYDVAQRLGEYLQLEPDRVYLHAGVTDGAKELGIETRGRKWLTMDDLPSEMHGLTANEAEDFICVYRTLFKQVTREDD